MTFSLHWIFTQAHILLTTAKCLEAKRFSNSLPTPSLAVLVIPPQDLLTIQLHYILLYSIVINYMLPCAIHSHLTTALLAWSP